MSEGIRATVRVERPHDCPIAQISAETGETTRAVSRSADAGPSGTVTEEFALNEAASNGGSGLAGTSVELAGGDDGEIFRYGSKRVYRFTRPSGRGCPCERVERFDSPVTDVHAADGSLSLTFHATDVEHLRAVIATLREKYPTVDVEELHRSPDGESMDRLVVFDSNELTARQREVLLTAHAMGYFEHPKGANAGEVAAALDITTSTFTEHLSAALRKLLHAIVTA